MADKLRTQQELERLQAKYIGTGHPDTTSWEWRTNIQRDTYSSIAGHRPLLSYIALAENEPLAKVRAQMIRVCLFPCNSSDVDIDFSVENGAALRTTTTARRLIRVRFGYANNLWARSQRFRFYLGFIERRQGTIPPQEGG
ncbi:hypothetical protein FALCPG4_005015 [Fusarium falciforme]